jgi:hypothetical protein
MESFDYIKTVLGIILGLSITHLLKGAVKIIDHPKKPVSYSVHLLWGLFLFLLLIHFWWWEGNLYMIKKWVFSEYFFLICYVTLFYILCSLLFPDDLGEYANYEEYFYSRKNWFFGFLASSFVFDTIDTYMKGANYASHLTWEYPVRNVSHIVLCLIAMKINNKKFHLGLVLAFLIYELSFILRLYYQ